MDRRPFILILLTTFALNAASLRGPDQSLFDAVKQQNVLTTRWLLNRTGDARPNVNATEPDGSTPLHWAAQRNNLEIVKLLLDAGANPKSASRYNITPLSLASNNGSAPIIERLLAAGVDPNSTSEEGQTALMTAARNGSPDAVKLLLQKGANPNAAEPFRGQTALKRAAGEGNRDAAALLVEFAAGVHAKSKAGFTPLLFAVRNNHLDAAQVLLDHGANINDAAADGTSALNMAILNAYYDLASVLLDRGADPNAPDPRGSGLHIIAWMRKPGTNGAAGVGGTATAPPLPTGVVTSLELVKKLLAKGANPNVRIDWQERPFQKEGGTTKNPPDIDLGRHLLTYNGATPFYVAAKNGDYQLMRLLADHGADAKITNRFGVTPLMVAACLDYWEGEAPGPYAGVPEAERLEAVKLAHQLGNEVNAIADFGNYPIEGDPSYTLLYYPTNFRDLQNLGMGDPRWSGVTALHASIISNQLTIVQYLLDHGADPTIKTKAGWTPLMMSRGVFLANAKKEFPAEEELIVKALRSRGIEPGNERAISPEH